MVTHEALGQYYPKAVYHHHPKWLSLGCYGWLWLAMAAMAMAITHNTSNTQHNPIKYIQTNKKEYIRVDDN